MNRNSIVTALLFIIVCILCYLVLHKGPVYTDNGLRATIDSMKVHDQQRDSLYSHLQTIHTQDSMRIDDIQDQLDGTNAMIDKINNIYDKKRNQLANSSLDDKLRFLSGHLPQSGNGR